MTELSKIYWRPIGATGLEQLYLRLEQDRLYAEGRVLRHWEGDDYLFQYKLEADHGFRTRSCIFSLVRATESIPMVCDLESDGQGHWKVNGRPSSELEGCLDIDLQVTPFTNTLAIKRLKLKKSSSAEIRCLYLPVPSLKPRAVTQRYTCLQPLGEEGGKFRYENLTQPFSVELTVDRQGLVLDYPEAFERANA